MMRVAVEEVFGSYDTTDILNSGDGTIGPVPPLWKFLAPTRT